MEEHADTLGAFLHRTRPRRSLGPPVRAVARVEGRGHPRAPRRGRGTAPGEPGPAAVVAGPRGAVGAAARVPTKALRVHRAVTPETPLRRHRRRLVAGRWRQPPARQTAAPRRAGHVHDPAGPTGLQVPAAGLRDDACNHLRSAGPQACVPSGPPWRWKTCPRGCRPSSPDSPGASELLLPVRLDATLSPSGHERDHSRKRHAGSHSKEWRPGGSAVGTAS